MLVAGRGRRNFELRRRPPVRARRGKRSPREPYTSPPAGEGLHRGRADSASLAAVAGDLGAAADLRARGPYQVGRAVRCLGLERPASPFPRRTERSPERWFTVTSLDFSAPSRRTPGKMACIW